MGLASITTFDAQVSHDFVFGSFSERSNEGELPLHIFNVCEAFSKGNFTRHNYLQLILHNSQLTRVGMSGIAIRLAGAILAL